MKEDKFIERRIVTGLIVSTEYLASIRKIWDSKLLRAKTAKTMANWCIEYYDEYHAAPGQEIESIFLKKTKGLSKNDKSSIEDILASLSDEYEDQEKFNVAYLTDQTIQYLDECNLRDFTDDISNDLDRGDIIGAKRLAYAYTPSIKVEEMDIDLSSPEVLKSSIEKAFTSTSQPVVKYARQLGEFLNDQLVRGGFVAFMSIEKRGKSFLMMDIAIKGVRQGAKVAFFQAGDMSRDQQLRRICIHLTKKSDRERYSGKMYEPVRDCIYNQLDKCDREERECDFGVFEGEDENFVRREVKQSELVKALKDNTDYKACHNCSKFWKKPWGAVWLKKVDTGNPLTLGEAKKAAEKFFVRNKRRFKLSTHPNKTLSVSDIDTTLDVWERKDGFVPDIIIVDYADILAPDTTMEFRHQENDKWMRLRALSQKKHCLVITATQADAAGYDKNRLSPKNFSEDKRKFAHVTAMYGLNQDVKGREKEIGILRINEIMIREDAFLSSNEVSVLQNLRRGQPCLSSFW